MRRIALLLIALALPAGAQWVDLLTPDLAGWEVLGDGVWRMRSDGVLTAHRLPDLKKLSLATTKIDQEAFHGWESMQSWLYTKKEYDEFDLSLEYWVRSPGNSGISIRDQTQAAAALTQPPDFSRTPSKVGYEIQINSEWPDPHPSGSIYGLDDAPEGIQRIGEWNHMLISSRSDGIEVRLNGVLVAEHPGDPKRPKRGPIGLQLHDQFSFVMFRSIWVQEVK